MGNAGHETLHSPTPDWTHQLGASRYMPTTVHRQLLGGLPCYPGVANQFKIVGPKVSQGTVAYKGLRAEHDASISFTVTHWLSCITPRWSWHGLAPLHEATYHALVRSLST